MPCFCSHRRRCVLLMTLYFKWQNRLSKNLDPKLRVVSLGPDPEHEPNEVTRLVDRAVVRFFPAEGKGRAVPKRANGARASHAVRRKKSAAKKKARANAMELLQGTLNKKLAGDGSAGDTACAQARSVCCSSCGVCAAVCWALFGGHELVPTTSNDSC